MRPDPHHNARGDLISEPTLDPPDFPDDDETEMADCPCCCEDRDAETFVDDICAECAATIVAECHCPGGHPYLDADAFRCLPLVNIYTIDSTLHKMEIRSCSCSQELGAEVDRHGHLLPMRRPTEEAG